MTLNLLLPRQDRWLILGMVWSSPHQGREMMIPVLLLPWQDLRISRPIEGSVEISAAVGAEIYKFTAVAGNVRSPGADPFKL